MKQLSEELRSFVKEEFAKKKKLGLMLQRIEGETLNDFFVDYVLMQVNKGINQGINPVEESNEKRV